MTRTRTTETLVSALVILLIALVLVLARATAHGESAACPTASDTATAALDPCVAPRSSAPARAER